MMIRAFPERKYSFGDITIVLKLDQMCLRQKVETIRTYWKETDLMPECNICSVMDAELFNQKDVRLTTDFHNIYSQKTENSDSIIIQFTIRGF